MKISQLLMKEINAIPDGYTIIATGPLTTETLAQEIVQTLLVKINFISMMQGFLIIEKEILIQYG